MKLKDFLSLYSPDRGFRIWKRINPERDWCYRLVSDCSVENKNDYESYLERKVERFDIVDNVLEIIVEQIGDNEYYNSDEKRKILDGFGFKFE